MPQPREEMKTEDQVPPEYKCPVCGKWGRRKDVRVPCKTLTYSQFKSETVYFCNPKARRGGKGCGELFRVILPERSVCAMIAPTWIQPPKEVFAKRVIELGYEMLELVKAQGLHDPHKRSTEWRTFYAPYLNSKLDSLCKCGCGRPPRREGSDFAGGECADLVYTVASYLASPGAKLTRFVCENILGGNICQGCNNTKKLYELELDHIKEVNEGGGMCWLDNFQVICRQCHAAKTAKYSKLRAERRRQELAAGSPQMKLFDL